MLPQSNYILVWPFMNKEKNRNSHEKCIDITISWWKFTKFITQKYAPTFIRLDLENEAWTSMTENWLKSYFYAWMIQIMITLFQILHIHFISFTFVINLCRHLSKTAHQTWIKLMFPKSWRGDGLLFPRSKLDFYSREWDSYS